MDILIAVLIINAISNIYAAIIIKKYGASQGVETPDMSDIYQKQLKNYQTIIKLNEKLIKDAIASGKDTAVDDTSDITDTDDSDITTERRQY